MTQYASPHLITEFAYQGRDIATDPRWAESGAPDLAAYTRWAGAICGMACLRMALLRRDGTAPHLFDLLDGALTYGTYVEEENGGIRGMVYEPFVRYVKAEHGLEAQVQGQLPVDDLIRLVTAGFTVITSVHKEIRNPERPPPGRGGHLVYVTGYADGALHLRNPSGHTALARKAAVPVKLFAGFYAERGISIA